MDLIMASSVLHAFPSHLPYTGIFGFVTILEKGLKNLDIIFVAKCHLFFSICHFVGQKLFF